MALSCCPTNRTHCSYWSISWLSRLRRGVCSVALLLGISLNAPNLNNRLSLDLSIMAFCSWCQSRINSNELTRCISEDEEKHNLCSSCHLSGHACQSSCPSCWYNLAQLLIIRESLCAGCVKPLQIAGRSDCEGHRLCEHCPQCLLCSFRQETAKDFFSLSYRDHEPRIQNILYCLQLCVQRIEVEREPCSICMEPLNDQEDQPVKTLAVCQHRFHADCIDKWFKQKSCCPCCRHFYRTHDEPSNTCPFIWHQHWTFFSFQIPSECVASIFMSFLCITSIRIQIILWPICFNPFFSALCCDTFFFFFSFSCIWLT